MTSGFSTSASLISTTFPESGAYRSLTAFTDSTTPNGCMNATSVPTLGSSTYTTSERRSAANFVMPIRARPPSRLTHSCSLEYRSSLGYTPRLRVPLIEWQPDHRPLDGAAADLDRDAPAGLGVLRGNESEPDAIPHRRPEAPARHHPDGRFALANGKPVARDRPIPQHKPHEAAGEPLALLALEGLGADEFALAELDRPPEPDFKGGRGFVHVVPVEEEPGLEPERVARPQPGGKDPRGPAGFEDGVPYIGGVRAVEVDLKPVLPRVAGAGDQGPPAGDLDPVAEPVVPDRPHGGRREALEDRLRARPLKGQQGDLGGPIGDVDVSPGVPADPGEILGGVRRVEDEHETIVPQPVHEQVVDDAPFGPAHRRGQTLTPRAAPTVGGEEPLGHSAPPRHPQGDLTA